MSYLQKSKSSGFTVIELLVTVALIGIFAAFAAPSFGSFIAKQRVDSSARSMTNLFSFIRAESVRLNLPVNVCPLSVNSSTLETLGCQGTPDWTSGVLTYADITNTGTDTYASGKAVRRLPIDSEKITVTGSVYNGDTRVDDDDVNSLLTFSPEGTYGNGTESAKFLLQATNDASICRVVILDNSGRARICQDSVGACSCDLN